MTDQRHQRLEEVALAPLTRASRGYWAFVGLLAAVVTWGLYAYVTQVRTGLVVTGMRDKVLWGLYITNFVFFIGISHAGTLLSAILRVSRAGWRVPVTRMAEFITVFALMVGAAFPMIDLGRPDRIPNIFLYGRWQSPILWDVLAIFTYLTGSIIYLYLPLIPDLALCRDRIGGHVTALKRWFYTVGAVGWQGTPGQHRRLGLAMGLMMVIIIPVAVSVHTVVSWIFAMTLRAGWNSTVFGIYFVAGAIFSGIATIIIVMAIFRRLYHLEAFITAKQFRYLGYMLGAFAVIMVYFNLSEYLVIGYKLSEGEDVLLGSLFSGRFASFFWSYVLGGLLLPALLVFLPVTRSILGVIVAAVLVDVSMWLERYLVVVASLSVPLMPYEPATYVPTWVEWSITAAAFAGFTLAITLFSRLFPVISIWEVKEQAAQEQAAELAKRLQLGVAGASPELASGSNA
jgi:molybdopterin-containing oxidoreductase family membrane subunit